MTTDAPALFNVEKPPAWPGVTIDIVRKGPRVGGSIIADQRNPMGRSAARLNYVRRADWRNEEERIALEIAAHWFAKIGGFAILSNVQLCHIVARLRLGHHVPMLHAAIDHYAASEWHRPDRAKNKPAMWMSLDRFFNSGALDRVIEQCAPIAAEKMVRRQLPVKPHFDDDGGPVDALTDDELRARFAAASRFLDADVKAKRAAMAHAFDNLKPSLQADLLKRQSILLCETQDWRECADIVGDAKWWGDVHHMAWVNYRKATGSDLRPEDVERRPTPASPFDLRYDALDAELTRRAAPMWTDVRTPGGSTGTPEQRMAVECAQAAIALRRDAWLADKPFAHESDERKVREYFDQAFADQNPVRENGEAGHSVTIDTMTRIRKQLEALRQNPGRKHAERDQGGSVPPTEGQTQDH